MFLSVLYNNVIIVIILILANTERKNERYDRIRKDETGVWYDANYDEELVKKGISALIYVMNII